MFHNKETPTQSRTFKQSVNGHEDLDKTNKESMKGGITISQRNSKEIDIKPIKNVELNLAEIWQVRYYIIHHHYLIYLLLI